MKGYTLIEVIIALLLLTIVLLGGTTLFFQNLRSTGLSEVELNLNRSLGTILDGMEKDIRYSTIDSVGTGTRDDCVAAGETGFVGNMLTVSDLNGATTVYALQNNKLASVSSQTNNTVYLNPSDIKIEKLEFTWHCITGVSDKMNIEIDGTSVVLGSGVAVTSTVSSEVNLLNSGLN